MAPATPLFVAAMQMTVLQNIARIPMIGVDKASNFISAPGVDGRLGGPDAMSRNGK